MPHPIFQPPPAQWGLRGDPYLWQELAQYFAGQSLPDSQPAFEAAIIEAVWQLTGNRLDECEQWFYVARYNHQNGLSAGGVSCVFWRQTALPLLWQRQCATPSIHNPA